MTVLRFIVPMRPVSVNAAYGHHPGGVHKTDAARSFGEAVAAFGLRARKAARWDTLTGPVDLLIGVRGKCDVVNVDKIATDALQVSDAKKRRLGAGIILDDAQVRTAAFTRLDEGPDRLEIAIGPVGHVFTLGPPRSPTLDEDLEAIR